MYTHGHTVGDVRRLPLDLLDALRAFETSKTLRTTLDKVFAGADLKLKMQEWQDYTAQLTEWERETTLDC
jgi:glutamate---methylamine ligase